MMGHQLLSSTISGRKSVQVHRHPLSYNHMQTILSLGMGNGDRLLFSVCFVFQISEVMTGGISVV